MTRPHVYWRWNAQGRWRLGMSVSQARAQDRRPGLVRWADEARVVLRAGGAYEPPGPANDVSAWWSR